ncbi:hypothetical protein KIPB_007307, partial [Kipferlia bialata]|eukprot:g7307.t1
MTAISETEFLLICGPYLVTADSPLQAWLCNTDTMKWQRCADPPVMENEDDGEALNNTFSAGLSGGCVHLLAHIQDADEGEGAYDLPYHAVFSLPTQEEPKGSWSIGGALGKRACHTRGFQPLGDNLALVFNGYGVCGYDTVRDLWGHELLKLSGAETE